MKRVVAVLLLAPAFSACGPPPETAALECDAPLVTDLGHITRDASARFATTGGRLRFAVDDPDDGTIAVTVDRTTVTLADEAHHLEVDVDSEPPGTLDVPAGAYGVAVESRDLTLAFCPGTGVSDVVPGVGTAHKTTPSPTRS